MSKFDGQLDAPLASEQSLIKAQEQDLLKGSLLTPSVLDSDKTTYLPGTEPSLEKTYYWLSQLARQLKQENTTEFLIERMQPSWLETPSQKWLYQISIGLITGLMVAMIYVGTTGLIGASIGGLSYGIILGFTQEIYPITRLKFSLEFAKTKLLGSVLEGLWWGLIYGIIDALICGLIWGFEGLILGMTDSLVWGLIEGVIWGVLVPEFYRTTVNNQAIRESSLNAGIFTVLGGVAWVLLYVGALLAMGEPLEPLDLLIDGIGNGVFNGIYVGGLACIQHFVLRLILKPSGAIPIVATIAGFYWFQSSSKPIIPTDQTATTNSSSDVWRSTQLLRTLSGPLDRTQWVTAFAFSPDGKTLASGSDDGKVKIWNLDTERRQRRFSSHHQR